ncbi:glycerophosphodiester phosphodiesterase family protein [Actinomycetospora sp. NBRC 106378]|uniref:glycerophosphodiester phosphodiesterase n=1 Tax=Actinomycetospora sp. NBRC 106378 TaxID=3032208 RepID=UPI0024A2CC11|nr:glycerophosphodiester phosphodiesterase family protein [Actinomycetospora sp. NBRC 106378]GLZ56321.1 hydrolase [Actinomycetospora sp. NBRC 106378]
MPEVIAHRGASADAPENTLAAITEARRQGADGVEVDVQRTADGVLVLHHDATPRRTTDAAAELADRPLGGLTLAELRSLDAGAGERIPTLADLLDAAGELDLFLELKDPWHYPGIGREVVAALAGRPAVVMSFDAGAVRELAGPGVIVGQLLAAAPDAALLDDIATYAELVTVDHRAMHADLAAAIRDRGMSPGVYTVNEGAEMRRMLDLGVDRIITDRPAVLGELLALQV